MAIARKTAAAGVSSQTTGVSLAPACPAVVDAGDILIAHIYWEGTTAAPVEPAGWTTLGGPYVVETTIARHWVYGKIADGSEDAAAVTFSTTPANTDGRGARIYSLSGRVAGTISQLVGGFSHVSHATDPQMPTVVTPKAGSLAIALVGQNDNNTHNSATGETGGDWTLWVTLAANLTPGFSITIQTATPTADPGTISGGSDPTNDDPVGTIGFWVRDNVQAFTSNAESGGYSISGGAAVAVVDRPSNAETSSYAITGADAAGEYVPTIGNHTSSNAGTGSYAVSDAAAAGAVAVPSNAEAGSVSIVGAEAWAVAATLAGADAGSYAVSGAEAAGVVGGPIDYESEASAGSYTISGAAAEASDTSGVSTVAPARIGGGGFPSRVDPKSLHKIKQRDDGPRAKLIRALKAQTDRDFLDVSGFL